MYILYVMFFFVRVFFYRKEIENAKTAYVTVWQFMGKVQFDCGFFGIFVLMFVNNCYGIGNNV